MGIGSFEWGERPFDTLISNGGPHNRLDVAILGDGYSRAELPLFYEDVDTLIDAFHTIEPTKSYIRHFNFHRVNVVSQQSGIDDRWQKPPVKRKSALGAHYSFMSERRLVGWDWRVWWVARKSGVPFNNLLVIVNTPRRGGATRFWMTVGYASRNSSDYPRIMIHEAGHAIAKLADEYTGELPNIRALRGVSLPNPLPFANVTMNGKKPKWREWINAATPLPTPISDDTPRDLIGSFEGASYTNFGVYKPTLDCIMRRHSQPFCQICCEQWIKRIYRISSIADAPIPAGDVDAAVNQRITFGAEVLKPQQIHTVWRVRNQHGDWEPRQETNDFAPYSLNFATSGRWTVECILEDHNTMLRKKSVINQTRQKLRWVVTVR